jgi:hypothetical protein
MWVHNDENADVEQTRMGSLGRKTSRKAINVITVVLGFLSSVRRDNSLQLREVKNSQHYWQRSTVCYFGCLLSDAGFSSRRKCWIGNLLRASKLVLEGYWHGSKGDIGAVS